jgi:hypothetical protein
MGRFGQENQRPRDKASSGSYFKKVKLPLVTRPQQHTGEEHISLKLKNRRRTGAAPMRPQVTKEL